MHDRERFLALQQQGFRCSQIMVMLGMELMGKHSPDLVAATEGLAGGIGSAGEVCGALTGGACVLGLYAGRSLPGQREDPRLSYMGDDLVYWVREKYGEKYGDIRCEDILAASDRGAPSPCIDIVQATFHKIEELLVEHGFDLKAEGA